ncbi:MAG: ABC transporter ATP-binding protein [Methylophilaceae bacterium]
MSDSDIAIRVCNLSKCYQIYAQPHDRLKQSIYPRLFRLFGKQPKQYFSEFWALRDISFEVKKGETVGIIGRNGSGKSTLLQMICGTLNPTSGSIQTKGRIAALLELGSGFSPEFTGRENIFMNATLLGLSKEETDTRLDDIIAFADIGDFIDQPVKKYSSGMYVRLAFAVQAMVNPDILIVDEALAVGDEKFQRKCFARLEDLKNKGTSIIFVSHSDSQIVELCDRVVLLDKGVRLMCADPVIAIRAYQKLIYAPQGDQDQLIKEYLAIEKNEQLDKELIDTAKFITQIPSYEMFDEKLKPDSTIVYAAQGAEIKSVQLINIEGNQINQVNSGELCKLEVTGEFMADIKDVYFGINIRSISGLIITGQRFPEESIYVEKVTAGSKFKLTYNCKMTLLSGVYFVGTGVWSTHDPICRHRIVDALMFRVFNMPKVNSFGYVDISSKAPNFELF